VPDFGGLGGPGIEAGVGDGFEGVVEVEVIGKRWVGDGDRGCESELRGGGGITGAFGDGGDFAVGGGGESDPHGLAVPVFDSCDGESVIGGVVVERVNRGFGKIGAGAAFGKQAEGGGEGINGDVFGSPKTVVAEGKCIGRVVGGGFCGEGIRGADAGHGDDVIVVRVAGIFCFVAVKKILVHEETDGHGMALEHLALDPEKKFAGGFLFVGIPGDGFEVHGGCRADVIDPEKQLAVRAVLGDSRTGEAAGLVLGTILAVEESATDEGNFPAVAVVGIPLKPGREGQEGGIFGGSGQESGGERKAEEGAQEEEDMTALVERSHVFNVPLYWPASNRPSFGSPSEEGRGTSGVLLFGFFLAVADDRGNALEVFSFAEVDEFDSLGVASGFTDFRDAGADHLALVGDEHEFVGIANGEGTGDSAGFLGGFHRDDALSAAGLDAVFLEAGAFAEAVFSGDEKLGVLVHDGGGDDVVAFFRADAPDADRVAALVAHFFLVEADALAAVGDENNFVLAVRHLAIDEAVAFLDFDGDDAAFADVFEVVEIRLFDDAAAGGKDDVEVFVPGVFIVFLSLDADGGGDFLVVAEFEEVGDRAAFAGAGTFRDFKDAFHVAATGLGEKHEVIVRGGGEEVFHKIAVLLVLRLAGGHSNDALASASLGAEGADERALDEAVVGERDDHAVVGNEVFDGDLAFRRHDLCAAGAAEFFLEGAEFVLDDREDAFFLRDDVEEVLDRGNEGVVFALDAVAFESGELIEPEVHNVTDLFFGELVVSVHNAGFTADEDAELFHGFLRPGEGKEPVLRVIAVIRLLDDLDEVVDVGEGDEVALEFFGFDFGLVEEEACAAEDDFAAVFDVAIDGFLEGKELRFAAVDGEHVHAERRFERGVLVEVVDEDLRVSVAFEFDDHAGVLGAFVAHIADAGENLLVDEFGDPLHEIGAVHVVGDLGDDDAFASAFALFDRHASAHADLAPAGFKILADAGAALDETARGEVGALDVGHETVDGDVGVVNLGADAIDALHEVVGGDIRGHADRDAGAAIDEEVREGGREDGWFGAGFVVVRDEIDGALVHVGHERGAEVLEAGLGVTHGGRRVAFDRSEVALAVHELFAHRPGLGHVNEGGVDRLVAVGVVVAHCFTDDLRALEMLAVRLDAEFVHGEKDAALRGFETVAGIRQGAGDDDRHRVVEKRLRHFVGHIYQIHFFVLSIHRKSDRGEGFGKEGNFQNVGSFAHPAVGRAEGEVLTEITGGEVDGIQRAEGDTRMAGFQKQACFSKNTGVERQNLDLLQGHAFIEEAPCPGALGARNAPGAFLAEQRREDFRL